MCCGEQANTMALLKSAMQVGGLTLASRLLGFVRDQLIAFTIGTGIVAEAYFVAQRLPNLFRALFAEGAFNNAFVPQFARMAEGEGQNKAFFFARDTLSVLFAWMLLFCALAMILMPWLMPVLAPGFTGDAEKISLATELTRICFPYLALMSLAALFGGVLNSLNRFAVPAAAPIVMNCAIIFAALMAWWLGLGNSPGTGRLLAWGITLSGVAQLALLMFAAGRAGARTLPGLPRLTSDVKRVIWLSVPGLISGGIIQINLLIATMLATGFAGGVAFLYYADRLFQLPLGLIGVAIGVVLLPTLSRKLRSGDRQGALDSQNRALEFALFLTLPAAAALIILGRPILHAMFEHGAFTRSDTLNVAPVLAVFALGLPAFTITKIFQPGFYAREDTKTPMYFAIAAVFVNVASSFILSRFMAHVGIALATSIAAWVNAGLLVFAAVKRGDFSADGIFKHRFPRMVIALFAMSAVLLLLLWLLQENYAEGASTMEQLLGLAVLIAAGVASYFLFAHVIGAFRISELRRALSK
jgi:putative peptidoglycan lipid II flippase